MNKAVDLPLSALHADDTDHNTSGNADFQSVLDARLSRRSVLRGGVGTAATAVLGGWGLAACGGSARESHTRTLAPWLTHHVAIASPDSPRPRTRTDRPRKWFIAASGSPGPPGRAAW